MSDAKKAILDTMAKHGITLTSVFVPWSQSRNAKQTDERGNPVYSLNWSVTVQRKGRHVLTTDYSAGEGHCPAYKQGARRTLDYDAMLRHEIETGKAATPAPWGISKGKQIEPDTAGVIASLVLDSSVLDSGGFEDWADNFGYDRDSRKAETVYRDCLEIALKLRSGIGQDALNELATACQDY